MTPQVVIELYPQLNAAHAPMDFKTAWSFEVYDQKHDELIRKTRLVINTVADWCFYRPLNALKSLFGGEENDRRILELNEQRRRPQLAATVKLALGQ